MEQAPTNNSGLDEAPGIKNESAQAAFERIDFQSLRQIYEEMAKRAMVPLARLNFLNRKDFHVETDFIKTLSPGSDKSEKGNNGDKKSHAIDGTMTKHAWGLSSAILAETIRQETAVAGGKHFSEKVIDQDEIYRHSKISERSGLQSKQKEVMAIPGVFEMRVPFTSTTSFGWLNDGVKEKISEVVFSEYLRRTPMYDKGLESNVSADSYSSFEKTPQKIFFNLLVERIAKEAGIPEETVGSAFIGAYFRGDNLDAPEITEMLNEVLGEKIKEKIQINSDDSLIPIIRLFLAVLDKKMIREKIQQLWERLQQNRQAAKERQELAE